MPMLRPATPLAVLFFAAFALLLLSVLSTPIIRAIPLATFKGVDFGVFGYNDKGQASAITIGYSTASVFESAADNEDFSLPPNTRTSLSSILIIHPIAAFLALICFGLAVAAHFHGPSHSPKYLLILVLVTFPTLLVSLLAFLVDILLFVPHMAWGGWIVLAATIIVMICIVLTCAMRRTLVSRKARQKRIAENAEMNGQNYYESRPQPNEYASFPAQASVVDTLPRADSPPPMDKGVDFGAVELQKKISDDRQPLNPSDSHSGSTMANSLSRDNSSGRYYGESGPPGSRGRGESPIDQYGNPVQMDGYGQPLRHQNSNGTMGSQRSRGGGPPPGGFYRGRGGPPRGGPPRGGFGPRGAFHGGPGGRRGPPPPGWDRGGRGGPMMMGGAAAMGAMGGMGRSQRGPPPSYGNDPQYGGPPPQNNGYAPYEQSRGPPMNDMTDPAMIGQAIEMDHINGVPSPTHPPPIGANYGLRDSDGDVQGMVGLQQHGIGAPTTSSGDGTMSPTSDYSRGSEYVPARAAWNTNEPQPPIPLQYQAFQNSSGTLPSNPNIRNLSPVQGSPVELAANNTPNLNETAVHAHKRKPSSDYYEDVDPRFASRSNEALPIDHREPSPASRGALPSSTIMPAALVAGSISNNLGQGNNFSRPSPPPNTYPNGLTADNAIHANSSYEDLPEGARSPAASEASHFTSVSQRPVNPNWRPGPGQAPGPAASRPSDGLLESNPDFGIPGVGPPARGRGGRGLMRGMPGNRGRGGAGMREPGVIGLGGMSGQGRYPGPEAI